MKKRNLIILIICICMESVVFSKAWAFGKKESSSQNGYDALLNHPDFVNIEYATLNEHNRGMYYIVNLTDGRKIEFNYIDSNTGSGGGTFAGVGSIGEYSFANISAYKYDESQDWEKIYGKHYKSNPTYIDSNSQEWRMIFGVSVASFANLSMLLGIKIETMTDAIDNYDKIIQLAQILAREQYFGNFKEIKNKGAFSNIFDTELQEKFPHCFINSENRKGFVYVIFLEGHGIKEWDEKIPEDRLKKYLGLE